MDVVVHIVVLHAQFHAQPRPIQHSHREYLSFKHNVIVIVQQELFPSIDCLSFCFFFLGCTIIAFLFVIAKVSLAACMSVLYQDIPRGKYP